MTLWQFFDQPVVLAALLTTLIIAAVFPIALRVAGLSGDQIVTVLQMTAQFFLNLISDLRHENKMK